MKAAERMVVGLLIVSSFELGWCLKVPHFTHHYPWLGLSISCFLLIFLFCLVAFKVRDLLTKRAHSRPLDLALFAALYLTAINLYALIYMHLDNLYAGPGGSAFLWEASSFEVLDFVYFSTITMTSEGYGDIVPLHWAPRMVAASQAVAGYFFGLIGVGTVVNSMLACGGEQE